MFWSWYHRVSSHIINQSIFCQLLLLVIPLLVLLFVHISCKIKSSIQYYYSTSFFFRVESFRDAVHLNSEKQYQKHLSLSCTVSQYLDVKMLQHKIDTVKSKWLYFIKSFITYGKMIKTVHFRLSTLNKTSRVWVFIEHFSFYSSNFN